MEEKLLEFAMDLIAGGTIDGIFAIFGGDGIDYKKLVKEFSEAVEKIVWDEALDEYSNSMNTLIQEFRDEYPNIESDEKKVSFITDRLNKLREDIDFLLQDNMIVPGMFHVLTSINLHIFMMIELDTYDNDSEDYVKTNSKYIKEWLPVVTKSLSDRKLPTIDRDVSDMDENLHVLNYGKVGFLKGGVIENGYVVATDMVCDKPYDKDSNKPCYMCYEEAWEELGLDYRGCGKDGWVPYMCGGGDEDKKFMSCKDFQPYWGSYYFDEKLRVSMKGQLGSELSLVRHYYRCDKRIDDGPFGCRVPIGTPSAKDQKSLANAERKGRITYLKNYYDKTYWIVKTISGWDEITRDENWPNIIK